ncbi:MULTISPECIES: cysteine desulfurase NifS [Methanosarcina]|uniref:Cysteine desulfurase IscS n=3 Tax=Methanosarcina barkeri TaxID=2208 RepID=A0A0E3LND9_METBA|nr:MULTISPECIES: cysteine desulfurase NifS [Methanosarcina]AKB54601.1 Cysteine desulfurase [Methanosarcina barkeri MS]AKB57320.1 Cysteine desulfurase [Methanosarcina barkeri 227]AKJ37875.1 cysteine desulfurase NifS1 [Methanosarcina barkeri CM1]OED03817.1 cysteine desulfurase NifS [Methanosarcina sp. A14]
MREKRFVYMDHAATTFTKPEVFEAMLPFLKEHFGNPSSLYSIGREGKEAIETAREQLAKALGASPEEIYFTSGGTESDNWAIKGTAFARRKKGKHIITTPIEHHAVLYPCKYLETQGFDVTYLPVDSYGLIDPAEVEAAIRDDTILISVMYANNEIGTIEPIHEIGEIAREYEIPFHTDAVQVIGKIPLEMKKKEKNVDMLSLSSHKFYGPKGIGALYLREGTEIDNYMHGGGQERKKRAGTENVAGIVGLGKAIELATGNLEKYNEKMKRLRDRLLEEVMKIPDCRLNGHPEKCLSNNLNFSFEYIEGESLLLMLDEMGICSSTGSACSSGSPEPSHVLRAIGLPPEIAQGSLRLTLGDDNSEEDIDYVLEVLPETVEKLRAMSPFYKPENACKK